MQGNTHPEAIPAFDLGRVNDDLPLEHLLLQLRRSPEQEQALHRLLTDLYDPNSERYHQWIGPTAFGQAFGVAQEDIATLRGWLESHGLRVNAVYPSGMVMDISATAGQLTETFHAEMHLYSRRGRVPKVHMANATDPLVPSALAAVVVGIVSLHDFRPHPMIHNVSAVRRNGVRGGWMRVDTSPAFSFPYQGREQYVVGPQDFATIYNVRPLWMQSSHITGRGESIAVVEDSNMLKSDWITFRAAFGLASFGGTLSQVHPAPPSGANNCSNPGRNGDESEAALDAEWASAVAPGASIVLASCANTATTFGGLIAAQNLLNSPTPPPIISMSYGACESDLGAAGNAAYYHTWQQAAAEGVSVFVATGDSGAAGCDAGSYATRGIAASGFASTPYNVAVGGTDFQDFIEGSIGAYWTAANRTGLESARSYIPEIPWNDSCASNLLAQHLGYPSGTAFCQSKAARPDFIDIAAGSGGPSAVYVKPAWQAGVIGIRGDGKRDVPDVSLFAADGLYAHALLFCMSDTQFGGIPCIYTSPTDAVLNSAGGTSFVAPAFAGIQALVNQRTGRRWGNPNPVLYKLAAAEYGSQVQPNVRNLAVCNATNGVTIGKTCVFQDVTRGSNAVVCKGNRNCFRPAGDIYGVLSSSSAVLGAAYTSGTGWDFATGLGSVNVTNLVTKW